MRNKPDMRVAGFIAKRYLFAKKSHNVINIISAISAIGMAVGTAALIIILSVYNGFDSLVKSMMSNVEPDLLITPATGKTFVPAKVKLPELNPGQRMDGTPDCKFANLPYKETPDTEIPFSDIDDAWNAGDINAPTTPVEVETPHNTPEMACKPEIAVSEADKGKSKGKAKLARQTTLRGVYVTCEIIDDVVSFTVAGVNGGANTAATTVTDIDNLIGELEEVKMALTAGVY